MLVPGTYVRCRGDTSDEDRDSGHTEIMKEKGNKQTKQGNY